MVIWLGNSIVIGILVGAVLTAFLGALITRRELRPAQVLVQQVHRIDVERFSYRADTPSTPAEVHEIGVASNAMLERLESGYERLYHFSADLAHDLHTPLNNLTGHTEVALSHEREAADYVTLLENNLAEYQCLLRMIDSILFLARADTTTVELDRVPIGLGIESSELASYSAILGEDKGVKIEVSASGSMSADLTMFRRAVDNLLSNAVRHADNGSVVSLNCQRDEDSITVHVLNQGVPIPDKDREHVFDRSHRDDQARSHSDQSISLGLAIVRSITELHAGTTLVATSPGSVTRFSFRFPFVSQRAGCACGEAWRLAFDKHASRFDRYRTSGDWLLGHHHTLPWKGERFWGVTLGILPNDEPRLRKVSFRAAGRSVLSLSAVRQVSAASISRIAFF